MDSLLDFMPAACRTLLPIYKARGTVLGMAACFVECAEGLGRCLVAGHDLEPGSEVLREPPLLAAEEADASDASLFSDCIAEAAELAVDAETGGPWSRLTVDSAAVVRLLGLLRAYVRSEVEVKRRVLDLDDGMEAGAAACLVRKLAGLFVERGLFAQLRKMELHCVL